MPKFKFLVFVFLLCGCMTANAGHATYFANVEAHAIGNGKIYVGNASEEDFVVLPSDSASFKTDAVNLASAPYPLADSEGNMYDQSLPADSALCYIYALLESDDYKINGVRLNSADAELQPVVVDTLLVDLYDGEVATGQQMTIYRISLYVYESYWYSEDIANEHDNVVIYCEFASKQPTLITDENYSEYNLSADYIGYYAIADADHLYWFANYVNSGNADVNAVLLNDIVINKNVLDNQGNLNGTPARTWTPIGTKELPYTGNFDGNGHTISGLYFNDDTSNGKYVGLFGNVYGTWESGELIKKAVIKNVGIVDTYINAHDCIGGICGQAKGVEIINCYNTGNLSGHGNIYSGFDDLGGICGEAQNVNIVNCYNMGKTIGSSYHVGGICGSAYGNVNIINCYNIDKVFSGRGYVGGILGYGSNSAIINCYNIGSIEDPKNYSHGGICGEESDNITNCYYLASSEKTDGARTSAQFANGTVATALHNYDNGETGDANINGAIWGQGFTDLSPDFSGEVVTSIAIDETNFPDANFRQYVLDVIDANDDEMLSKAEASRERMEPYGKGIYSLQGIEFFTSLMDLHCSMNQLTSLDVSKNVKLERLNCSSNKLSSLDLSNNVALYELACSFNQLTSLDLSNNVALDDLQCSDNQLTSLNISNSIALRRVSCADNQLVSLDLSNNVALRTLECELNQLISLDLSNNIALDELFCTGNQLTSLDMSKNINLSLGISELNVFKVDASDFVMPNVVYENVSNVVGATIEKDETTGGTRFIATDAETSQITYAYDVENPNFETPIFTIEVEVFEPIAVDETNFPDANFRQYVLDEIDADEDGTLSKEEIEATVEISCSGKEIESLKGIEYFTALESLACGNNKITELDLSANTAVATLVLSNNVLDKGIVESTGFVMPNVVYENVSNVVGATIEQDETTGGTKFIPSSALITEISYTYDVENSNVENPTFKLVVSVFEPIAIDETNFPDENFRQYVLDEIDINDDEFLNASECVATKQIDCSNMEIASLQGIEFFTGVTELICNDNKLTSVDLSLNTALQSFNCYYNQLTSLDVSANTELTKLLCDYNNLSSLDLSKNTNLEYLECSANKIESLDLSNNINLSYFNGYGNKLKSFDLSKNTKLNQMSCDFNQLTSLTVSPEVEYSFYSCAGNKYEALEFNTEGGIVMPNVVFEKVSNCSENVVATKDEATGGTRFTVVDNTVEEFTYTYNIDNTSIPSAYYPIFTIVCPVDDALYVAIDETNFPDSNFRQEISSSNDLNDDGKLSPYEIRNASGFIMKNKNISSIQGIELFTNLFYLDCSGNNLTSVDLSNNTKLNSILMDNNQLDSIDVSHNIDLVELSMEGNQLTSIDLSQNSNLHNLNLSNNHLTDLDLSNNKLLLGVGVKCEGNTFDMGVISMDGFVMPNVDVLNVWATAGANPDGDITTGGTLFMPWMENSTSVSYQYYTGNDGVDPVIFTISFAVGKKLELSVNDEDFGEVFGAGAFVIDSTVEFSATPKDGYHFVKWSDENTDAEREITMTEDIALTAIFAAHEYGEWDTTVVATCESDGERKHTCSCGHFETEEIPALGHNYGEPTFAWSVDKKSAIATFACEKSDDSFNSDCEVEIDTVLATCTADGYIKYVATIEYNEKEYGDTINVVLPATGHNYEFAEIVWSVDKKSAIATFACEKSDDSFNSDCEVEIDTVLATCTTDGYIKYVATVEYDETVYGDTITVVLPATGHNYEFAEIVWSDDKTSATATFACVKSDDSFNSDCEVEIDTVLATCTADGYIKYVATIEYNEKEYGDTINVVLPATGHNYEFAEIVWSDDKTSATATFACVKSDDSVNPDCVVDIDTVLATCTADGYIKYVATVEYDEKEYGDTINVVLPATGHNYEFAEIVWSDDKTSAIATFACEKSDDSFNSDCDVEIDTVWATCTADGYIKYVATIEYNEKEYGDTINVVLPATGHNYEFAEIVWSDDKTSAIATFACEKSDDSFNSDCDVEIDTVLATCTADGYIKYVATIEYNEKEYGDTINVVLPAKGHVFGEPTFAWTEFSAATATFVCEKEDSTKIVDGVITADTTIAPTTESEGLLVYTATFTFNGETYTDTKEEILDKLPFTAVDDVQANQVKVWGYNRIVYIENAEGVAQVFDATGRLLKSVEIYDAHSEIPMERSGVYIVVVEGKSYQIFN